MKQEELQQVLKSANEGQRIILPGANLSGANLSGADLSGANLSGANLTEADLSGANLTETLFNHTNLIGTKGVEVLLIDSRKEKGYQLIRWYLDGQPWYNSGCRSFNEADALAHWGGKNYADPDRGRRYVEAIKKGSHEVARAKPIVFNRHDFSGKTGIIFPTGTTSFIIDGITGSWKMTECEGIVTMTSREDDRRYLGFKSETGGKTYFAEMGCEREDEDPRIAFAQVMHNI